MDAGASIAAVAFVTMGGVIVYAGYRIRRTERADLIFAPGIDVPDRAVARVGGFATSLAGIATIALGIGTILVSPAATGWLPLLGLYTAACLVIGVGTWWRLRNWTGG